MVKKYLSPNQYSIFALEKTRFSGLLLKMRNLVPNQSMLTDTLTTQIHLACGHPRETKQNTPPYPFQMHFSLSSPPMNPLLQSLKVFKLFQCQFDPIKSGTFWSAQKSADLVSSVFVHCLLHSLLDWVKDTILAQLKNVYLLEIRSNVSTNKILNKKHQKVN